MNLAIQDERLGEIVPVGTARFGTASISIRELIRARVELEVERWRDPEARSSSPPLAAGKAGAEPAARIQEAEDGFERGRYFILVDERQAESLDERVDLARTSGATFLMITPLQGG